MGNLIENLEGRVLFSGGVVSTKVAALTSEAAGINADFVGVNRWLADDRTGLAQSSRLGMLDGTKIRAARIEIAALQRAVNTSKRQIIADFKKLSLKPTDANLAASVDAVRAGLWASQSADQAVITSDLKLGDWTPVSAASGGTVSYWIAGTDGAASYSDPNSWNTGTVPGVNDVGVLTSVSVATPGTGAVASGGQRVAIAVTGGMVDLVGEGQIISSVPVSYFNSELSFNGASSYGGETSSGATGGGAVTTSGGTLTLTNSDPIQTVYVGSIADTLTNYAGSGGSAATISFGSAGTVGSGAVDVTAGSGSYQMMTGWTNGDFNYDGVVNGSDYAMIDNTFDPSIGVAPVATVPGR